MGWLFLGSAEFTPQRPPQGDPKVGLAEAPNEAQKGRKDIPQPIWMFVMGRKCKVNPNGVLLY